MGSPVAISRASSESHGKRSPISGPSPLYPWLKSEPKIPDLDSEKGKDHSKRGFQTKSPPRPSNFSIQSLASERAEIRPSPLGTPLELIPQENIDLAKRDRFSITRLSRV
jgi:hypothetical protein